MVEAGDALNALDATGTKGYLNVVDALDATGAAHLLNTAGCSQRPGHSGQCKS